MKPPSFKYSAAHSVEEAVELLGAHGDEAALLAGGQSLVPAMNFRLACPTSIIDLNPVKELAFIRIDDKRQLRIGAMTRQRGVELSSIVKKQAPLLHAAMPCIAHAQIRNRGTVGGSIAHADPSAELPAVMVALEASFLLRNREGERWVRANRFFEGMFSTVRQADELLVEIEIPPIPDCYGWSFREIARRRGDYAMAGVAVSLSLDAEKRCSAVKMVFLSAGDGVVEAVQAENIAMGGQLSEDRIKDAASVAASEDIAPLSDLHATAEYRRRLSRAVAVQALTEARDRALSISKHRPPRP